MEAIAGLVAGSHNRNELVVIRRDGETDPRPLQALSGQICQICGDEIGLTVDDEFFVACNECAFPVRRICYEYERREGSQVCPQFKTRYKHLKGCARVINDEEEDDVDDIDNEFNFIGRENQDMQQHVAESMLQVHMGYGGHFDDVVVHTTSTIPLLTNGKMVIN